jgi:hypothetical protein
LIDLSLAARQETLFEFGFLGGMALHKKANLTTGSTRMAKDLQFKKALLNFLDPCKSLLSVLSVARFCVFVQSTSSYTGRHGMVYLGEAGCTFCPGDYI